MRCGDLARVLRRIQVEQSNRGATMRNRIRLAIAIAAGAAALAAATDGATADGLPVPGGLDTTPQGVLSADGSQRFLAVSQGEETLLARINADGGALERSTWLDGAYAVPGVALDGSTSGLAHDDGTLVLIKPRRSFPQKETRMIVIDPETLKSRRVIDLDGDFSFDAISPDGRFAFMIEYPAPKDPTDYQLRRLDLTTGELEDDPILPENEPGEEMRGFPLSRTSSPDGRWAYTLYDGGNIYRYGGKPGEPFVHAIDTVAGVTLCIDLEFVPVNRLAAARLQMSADGSAVEVTDPRDGVLGTIAVGAAEAEAEGDDDGSDDSTGAAAGEEGDGGGGDAAAIALGAGALALALGGRRARRSQAPAGRRGAGCAACQRLGSRPTRKRGVQGPPIASGPPARRTRVAEIVGYVT